MWNKGRNIREIWQPSPVLAYITLTPTVTCERPDGDTAGRRPDASRPGYLISTAPLPASLLTTQSPFHTLTIVDASLQGGSRRLMLIASQMLAVPLVQYQGSITFISILITPNRYLCRRETRLLRFKSDALGECRGKSTENRCFGPECHCQMCMSRLTSASPSSTKYLSFSRLSTYLQVSYARQQSDITYV